MDGVYSLNDLERLAAARLSDEARAFIGGGSGDEVTLRHNVEAFRSRRLLPRVMVDVTNIDAATEMLGVPVSFPVGLAPVAQQRFAHPDAELASAEAAAAVGVVFCLSTLSSCSIEEVAACGGPRWFQLYVNPDRAVSEDLMNRAARAGYSAIVLTVDLPVAGWRERELRAGVGMHLDDLGNMRDLPGGEEALRTLVGVLVDPSVTWEDIAWAKEVSGLPVVVKGILAVDDAVRAVGHGAAAIVVSNHGGRQLDRSPAPIEVLEDIADAVGGRAEIYLDGGVRRGVDVATALALGADAAFIGRPYVYALAVGGRDGVAAALRLLHDEVINAMTLLGARTVAEVGRSHVV